MSSVESRNMPSVAVPVPTIGNGRQRPVRLIIWPAMIDEPNTPKNSGTSNRPELLADAPFAIWRNVGR